MSAVAHPREPRNEATRDRNWQRITYSRKSTASTLRSLGRVAAFCLIAFGCPILTGSPPVYGLLSDCCASYFSQFHESGLAMIIAVSKFELTFDEWDACVAYGDCAQNISDSGFGRGRQPIINVVKDEAQRYVAWLSRMTGKSYRLLTEAEYEYATRLTTST
jgi:hypothetical protein